MCLLIKQDARLSGILTFSEIDNADYYSKITRETKMDELFKDSPCFSKSYYTTLVRMKPRLFSTTYHSIKKGCCI